MHPRRDIVLRSATNTAKNRLNSPRYQKSKHVATHVQPHACAHLDTHRYQPLSGSQPPRGAPDVARPMVAQIRSLKFVNAQARRYPVSATALAPMYVRTHAGCPHRSHKCKSWRPQRCDALVFILNTAHMKLPRDHNFGALLHPARLCMPRTHPYRAPINSMPRQINRSRWMQGLVHSR